MTEARNDDEARIKVRSLIKDIGTAMMVTQGAGGGLSARPMQAAAQDEDGVTLWFFTRADTRKTQQIAEDAEVLLCYSDPRRQDYAVVHGQARVTRDPARQKALWSAATRVWFPKGPESEDLALVAVRMTGAEYWDSPASSVLFAYGYAKAVLTGEAPSGGEHREVAFGGGTA